MVNSIVISATAVMLNRKRKLIQQYISKLYLEGRKCFLFTVIIIIIIIINTII